MKPAWPAELIFLTLIVLLGDPSGDACRVGKYTHIHIIKMSAHKIRKKPFNNHLLAYFHNLEIHHWVGDHHFTLCPPRSVLRKTIGFATKCFDSILIKNIHNLGKRVGYIKKSSIFNNFLFLFFNYNFGEAGAVE